jgi:hypothetical protein
MRTHHPSVDNTQPAGEGFIGAARLEAAFAGKPAPTQMRTHHPSVGNTQPVGAGLPAKATVHTHADPNFYDGKSSSR